MADAFINYSRTDTDIARRIAASLAVHNLSVWWDRDVPIGTSYLETIEEALRAAACIITVWSPDSVRSEWVQAEANFAISQNKLLPIAIGEDVTIPLQFRTIQTDFLRPGEIAGDAWLDRLADRVRDFRTEASRQSRVEEHEAHSAPTTDAIIVPVSPMPSAVKKAFISHADEDEEIAIELVKHLESSGCSCWIAFRDVDPGDDYRLSITKAMDQIVFLVLIYSKHVNTSFDVATELLLARKRRRKRFVLRTDDTEPRGPVEYELATVQWVDCRSDRRVAFERIAQRSTLLASS